MNPEKIKLMSVAEKEARIKELTKKIEKVDYTTYQGYNYFTHWLKEKEYIKGLM
jgi:hypothetical protein